MARLGGECWNVCDDRWCHIIKLAPHGRLISMLSIESHWLCGSAVSWEEIQLRLFPTRTASLRDVQRD
jgi:hypothetical protein